VINFRLPLFLATFLNLFMKKLLFILPALFFTLIFATCKKNPTPDNNYPYFQCKINGKTYIPNNCANCLTCTIYQDTIFLLGANAGFEALTIGINDNTEIKATSYILNEIIGRQGTYKNSTLTNDRYFTDETHTGQLTITTLDKTNKTISGTFYFKAYNAYRNDSVSVTDGKFQLNYTTN
jgi:hypothetical protein